MINGFDFMKIFIINIALLSFISIILSLLISSPKKKVQKVVINQIERVEILEQFILMVIIIILIMLSFHQSLGLSIQKFDMKLLIICLLMISFRRGLRRDC